MDELFVLAAVHPVSGMTVLHAGSAGVWPWFTRLGEAQILLPVLMVLWVALLRRPAARALALHWAGALVVAVALTTASKLAFIGWCLGWPALNFTGISGHAMFAAAIYPLLLGALAPPRGRGLALCAGALLATAVGVSRVAVHAHSVSEVVAGLTVGGAATAWAVWRAVSRAEWRAGLTPPRMASQAPVAVPLWAPVAALLWFASLPAVAPPSNTHSMVTRLALRLSGHAQPCMRAQWRVPSDADTASDGSSGLRSHLSSAPPASRALGRSHGMLGVRYDRSRH